MCKPIKTTKTTPDTLERITTIYTENMNNYEYEQFTMLKNRQKSRQNNVGLFNQDILGSCDGWESRHTGVDLYNSNRNIYIELKNRYNTLNSDSKSNICKKLQELSKNSTCYLGHIIPKNKAFTKKMKNYDIIEICGSDLFELITGSNKAEKELYDSVNEYFEYKKLKMNII